jgi:hypothetical protein
MIFVIPVRETISSHGVDVVEQCVAASRQFWKLSPIVENHH